MRRNVKTSKRRKVKTAESQNAETRKAETRGTEALRHPSRAGSGTNGSPVGAQHDSPGRKPWESGATTCHQPRRGGTPNGAGDRIEAQIVSPLRGLFIRGRSCPQGLRPGMACSATPWLAVAPVAEQGPPAADSRL